MQIRVKAIVLMMAAALVAAVVTVQAKKSEPATAATCSEQPGEVRLADVPREKHERVVTLVNSARETGTCKSYNEEKGYGYITPDVGGSDVFVHSSALQTTCKCLVQGQRVEYDRVDGPKGPYAKDVSLIDEQ